MAEATFASQNGYHAKCEIADQPKTRIRDVSSIFWLAFKAETHFYQSAANARMPILSVWGCGADGAHHE